MVLTLRYSRAMSESSPRTISVTGRPLVSNSRNANAEQELGICVWAIAYLMRW
jgi:hypothetical protein